MTPRLARGFALIILLSLGALLALHQGWLGSRKVLQAPAGPTSPQSQTASAGSKPSGTSSATQPVHEVALDDHRPCFAFAVSNGHELFMEGDRPLNADLLTRAMMPSGESRPIHVTAFQMGDADSNGRDAAYNLNHLQGTRYAVLGDPLEEDRSYLLASDAFLVSRTALKVSPIQGALPPEAIPPLEQLKKRKVEKSWALADLGGKGRVYWVIFDPVEGKRALASMVLLAPKTMATQDVLGPEDGRQSWRAGEDEDTAGEGFSILYACEAPTGLEWAYSWAAEEGEDLGYAVQKGDLLEDMQGTNVYRYHAPM